MWQFDFITHHNIALHQCYNLKYKVVHNMVVLQDLKIRIDVADDIIIGADIEINVTVKNDSGEEKAVEGKIHLNTLTYTGQLFRPVKHENTSLNIGAGSSEYTKSYE